MATWYVAPTGTTTTQAGTRDNPFLCSAINWTPIAAGDTIYLRTALGNYNETLTIGKSGSAGSYITIDSDPLDGGKAVIDGQSTRFSCITNGAKTYIQVKNISVKNTATASNTGIVPSHNWIIDGCEFNNHTNGVFNPGIQALAVQNCTFIACSTSVNAQNFSSGLTIKNITCTATTGANLALDLWGTFAGVLAVENVTITGGTATAYANIMIQTSSACTAGSYIKNVTIDGGRAGIAILSTTANITLSNCMVKNNFASQGYIVQGGANNLVFNSCIADNCVGQGFNFATNAHDIVLNNCVSSNNTLSGFAYDASYNLSFNNCIAQNNLVDGFTATNGSHDITHNRCIATKNATRNPTPGSDGDGFTSHDTCYNLDYFFCAAFGNANTGFAMVGTSAGRIYQCTSAFNGNGINTTRAGIFISTSGDNATAAAGSKSWKMKNSISYKDYPRSLYFTAAAIGSTSWSFDYNSYKPLDDNSFATIDGGSTNISWTTYHASYEANSKNEDAKVAVSGKIPYDSVAVDTAPWMSGFNDGGQSDPWGKKVYGLPNTGADQGAGMPYGGRLAPTFGTYIR